MMKDSQAEEGDDEEGREDREVILDDLEQADDYEEVEHQGEDRQDQSLDLARPSDGMSKI